MCKEYKSNDNNGLTLGLFGFGVVGKGLYDVLHNTPGLQTTIKRICIKDPQKKRPIDAANFTTDANDILNDDSINVVVELIDDADAAFAIAKAALQKGKAVVSANKKMIAANFKALLQLQREYNTPLLYEGACCASIPIIRNLEEYYDTDLLSSVRGIINGSTNYILTQMFEAGLSFKEALLQAQQLGFAESNPALDIEGHDAANKLCILLAHSFGAVVKPQDFIYTGITGIKPADAILAQQKNKQIKLVATAKKLPGNRLAAFVLPQLVSQHDDLAGVHNEFNALVTESSFADKHFFKGKGAGAFPTAAAVLSDIAALRHNYKYEYKKLQTGKQVSLAADYFLKVFVSAASLADIPHNDFEWIEEWHNQDGYVWLVGVISAGKLQIDAWWKAPGVSLLLTEDAIIDNIDYKKIGQRSLELAGVGMAS